MPEDGGSKKMPLRLTLAEASKLGIGDPHTNYAPRVAKRRSISEYLSDILNARVSMKSVGDGYLVTIHDVPLPSWNTVLRWDIKREFYSYNKAWHTRLRQSALEAGLNRENRTDTFFISIFSYRKRLIDYDNICVKQVIDGCVKSGLIVDDSPKYITGYCVRQIKSAENVTTIAFERS